MTYFRSYDQAQLLGQKSKLRRDETSQKIYKEVQHEGKTYMQPWRLYRFTTSINHGLARTTECLPADITVSITFHRAPASFSLIKMDNKIELEEKGDRSNKVSVDFSYPESVIPISSAVLRAYYSYSLQMEQMMSKVTVRNYEITFMDYIARRTVLESGLNLYDLNLMQGKLPKYLVFGLSSLERISGDETLSLTRFVQGDLTSFDLILGNLTD